MLEEEQALQIKVLVSLQRLDIIAQVDQELLGQVGGQERVLGRGRGVEARAFGGCETCRSHVVDAFVWYYVIAMSERDLVVVYIPSVERLRRDDGSQNANLAGDDGDLTASFELTVPRSQPVLPGVLVLWTG